MSKVKIKNISKSKSPIYCGLKDNSSLSLQFGQSLIVSESLLTDYIKRREKLGDIIITKVSDVVNPSESKQVTSKKTIKKN